MCVTLILPSIDVKLISLKNVQLSITKIAKSLQKNNGRDKYLGRHNQAQNMLKTG
ncbi:hypothetical protein GCM10022414_09710 [Zhongshania borealis]|uniref:Uncharacterized protein n=1 Tax=Zhongshania borealis TaxID=889488 RepID=A0ABP7WHJ4_9GAMM